MFNLCPLNAVETMTFTQKNLIYVAHMYSTEAT